MTIVVLGRHCLPSIADIALDAGVRRRAGGLPAAAGTAVSRRSDPRTNASDHPRTNASDHPRTNALELPPEPPAPARSPQPVVA
ncbi:hypothetical protein ACFV0T_39720 [Streptomyces sp. NPDC059582]|uniref:hypothetical protein n=1 Tax=Streptomyces sp. NPDC059582 TaxID=3346875 RepID=UPI00368ADFCE